MNYKLIQQALTESVDANMADYIAFVNRIMNDEKFWKCAKSLLPFDGVVHTDISFPSSSLTLGLSLMRMDIESDTFALGITIAMDSTPISEKPFSATNFISAAKTFGEMSAYVNTSQFKDDVRENFHKQIEERTVNAETIPIN